MEYNPQSSKDLAVIVDFFRLFLKQSKTPDSRIIENYLSNLLDEFVLLNAPPNSSQREIINYRFELEQFIRS